MNAALTGATLAAFTAAAFAGVASETVDFRVDPDNFDANMDGFITGNELLLTGSDGTNWQFTPLNNLVGSPRMFVSEDRGLRFGGGGGSTLTFEFSVDRDVTLEAYTILDAGIFILGNPTFQILQDDDLLSDDNDADTPGTFGFENGPIELEAGLLYTFDATTVGAGIQSFFESWSYVPTPGSMALLAMGGVVAGRRRR